MRHRFLLILAFAFFAGLLPSSVHAQEIPYLTGHINDYAGILSASTVSALERELRTEEDSTTNQIAVLTVNSLEGGSLEDYSMRVAETWKLGQKGRDNGVLLLIAKDDRKVRIEVGYGLEGVLTDALCSVIIRREILPQFKSGNYDGGVQAGVESIVGAIRGTYTAEQSSKFGRGLDPMGSLLFLLIFLGVAGIFTLVVLFSKGMQNLFLFFFLIPFWYVGPMAVFGSLGGAIGVGFYLLATVVSRIWFTFFPGGRAMLDRMGSKLASRQSSGWTHTGGWYGGGGGFSSGGGFGGFSGGGGSFGGGGSSGSW